MVGLFISLYAILPGRNFYLALFPHPTVVLSLDEMHAKCVKSKQQKII